MTTYQALLEDDGPPKARQSYRGTIEISELISLKALLDDIAQIIDRSPAVLDHRAAARNLTQSLLVQTFGIARRQLATSTHVDRAQRNHAQTVKRVHDYLRQCPAEPVFVGSVPCHGHQPANAVQGVQANPWDRTQRVSANKAPASVSAEAASS